MASHLRDVAKQWWRVAILQRWNTAHSHQRSTNRIHHSRRRFLSAGARTRLRWRKIRIQSVLPRVPDQCQRVVLRPFGKNDQEYVDILPGSGSTGGPTSFMASKERLLFLFHLLVIRSVLGDDYSSAPDTLCSIFSTKIWPVNRAIIIVKRESQLWRVNVKYKVIADEPWTQVYTEESE